MQIPNNVGLEDECTCMHFAAETWPIDFFLRCLSLVIVLTMVRQVHVASQWNMVEHSTQGTKTYQNIPGSTRFVSAGIRRGCRNGVGEVLRALVASVEALKR